MTNIFLLDMLNIFYGEDNERGFMAVEKRGLTFGFSENSLDGRPVNLSISMLIYLGLGMSILMPM